MRKIADGLKLAEEAGLIIFKQARVETNILFIELTERALFPASELAQRLEKEHSVKIDVRDARTIRIVTHCSVTESDSARLITGFN